MQSATGSKTHPRFRKAEAGMVHTDCQITGEDDFKPPTNGISVNQRHHWFVAVKTLGESCKAGFRDPILSTFLPFLQIGTDTESPRSFSGDGSDNKVRVICKSVECF